MQLVRVSEALMDVQMPSGAICFGGELILANDSGQEQQLHEKIRLALKSIDEQ